MHSQSNGNDGIIFDPERFVADPSLARRRALGIAAVHLTLLWAYALYIRQPMIGAAVTVLVLVVTVIVWRAAGVQSVLVFRPDGFTIETSTVTTVAWSTVEVAWFDGTQQAILGRILPDKARFAVPLRGYDCGSA